MKKLSRNLSFLLGSWGCGLCLLVWTSPEALFAQDTGGSDAVSASSAVFAELDSGVRRFKLSNGLRVVFFERKQTPVFSAQIWVGVGGVNEVPGQTGVSHLLEHMAFKGTTTVGTKDYKREKELLGRYEELLLLEEAGGDSKPDSELEKVKSRLNSLWIDNDFASIYQRRGAVGLNAATSKDYTFYMVSLPSVEFELWCWMESERLLHPVFRQFYEERKVVLEERRTRVDDNPGGMLYEAFLAAAYTAHPYRLPLVGWPSDVSSLRREDLEEYHRKWYRPENIVIGLVGDLEPERIKPLLEKYFGRLLRGQEPLREVQTEEPAQKGERKVVVLWDAEPRIFIGYHKPSYPDPADLSFTVLRSILSGGRSSVLFRELVEEKHLAASVYAGDGPGDRYPQLFFLNAAPHRGVESERLVAEIQKIIDRYQEKPVDLAELEQAKKRVRAELVSQMTTDSKLARELARNELLWGDWRAMFRRYDLIQSVSQEDIQETVRRYLGSDKRTVALLERGE